jgi:hypothetical protein
LTIRRRRLFLIVIIACALTLRLGVYVALPNIFMFERTGSVQGFIDYDILAQNLLYKGFYGMQPGVGYAQLAPLYPYTLAALYATVGRGSLQIVLLNLAFDAVTLTLIFQIARRLMPRGTASVPRDPAIYGLLAAAFFGAYPYLVFQSLTVNDTSLFTMMLHVFIFIMLLLKDRPRLDRRAWLLIILGGVILGLEMLDRPIIAAMGLAALAWFSIHLGVLRATQRLIPVAVVAVAVITPWNIRNYQVFGQFVNIGTHGGMNFWFGNSELTIPYFRAGIHTQWASPGSPPEPLDALEMDRWLYQQAFNFLREHPDRIPELTLIKLGAFWSIDIFPTRNPVTGGRPLENYQGTVRTEIDDKGEIQVTGVPENDPLNVYASSLFDRVGRLVHVIYFGSLLALAVVGLALTRRHWREVSFIWCIQIAMTVIYVIASGPSTRYRVPTDSLLFMLAAFTLTTLYDTLRIRRGIRPQTH